jgi:hypothetical protein
LIEGKRKAAIKVGDQGTDTQIRSWFGKERDHSLLKLLTWAQCLFAYRTLGPAIQNSVEEMLAA